VYVARVPTKRIMTVAISVGTRFPAYATSMGRVLLAGMSSGSLTTEATDFNQADTLMWKDMDTLPLFEEPTMFAWSSGYANVVPNASSAGFTWNAQEWGLKA